jgi:pyruvyltransferase
MGISPNHTVSNEIHNLRWWCPSIHNFGDEVSPYLFKKMTGYEPVHVGISHNENTPHYCTVGSMIQECNEYSILWGTGYHNPNARFRAKPMEIHAVRGPLTRKQLLNQGCGCPEVYGDPALLLSKYYNTIPSKRYEIGVIPHYVDKDDKALKMFDSPNIKIIDVQGGVEYVINEMLSCNVILSSSLHGIIAADSYGIPAYWYRISSKLVGGSYKFLDYFKSVNRDPIELRSEKYSTVSDILVDIKPYNITIDLNILLKSCPFLKETKI